MSLIIRQPIPIHAQTSQSNRPDKLLFQNPETAGLLRPHQQPTRAPTAYVCSELDRPHLYR